jgi:uncharacterized protein YecT (DUF1311 family)
MTINDPGKQRMNRKSRFYALVLGVLTITVTAQAVAKNPEDECMRLHPGITSPVEMVACASDLKGSREALETSYSALVKQVFADRLRQLEKAETAWLSFRDAQCEYNAGGSPGSTMNTSDVIGCTATMNRQRAAELRTDLKRWSR